MYFGVFLALMVFTAITYAVALYDLGPLNNIVALGIAAIKASLVVYFFMHVKDATKMTGVVILAAIFWLAILVLMTGSDFYYRGAIGVPGK